MRALQTSTFKAALAAIHFSGAHQFLAPFTKGCGAIFMLHRVSPDPVQEFEPNRILRITPRFLEQTIINVQNAGFDVVSLDEAYLRLTGKTQYKAPFICFTFDDGYRDNLEFAYPILKRHRVPATIYIPSNYPDGGAELWWITLEHVIRESDALTVVRNGEPTRFDCATPAQKEACYADLWSWLRRQPETLTRQVVRDLAENIGVDQGEIARELIMNWSEVRELAADPLITIGAHTCDHLALSKLSEQDCEREIAASIAKMEDYLGRSCRHFAYPYGDEESTGEREFEIARRLGVRTAVTTRKGVIHRQHRDQLSALPRVSLNGDFQESRYVDVLLSGAPFALWNAMNECASFARKYNVSLFRSLGYYFIQTCRKRLREKQEIY